MDKRIEIKTNARYKNEKDYIFFVLFSEFLGLNYRLTIGECSNYELTLSNGNKLVIEDHFFNNIPNCQSYLSIAYMPAQVRFINNNFATDKNILSIYGTEKLKINPTKIICGIDIFASSFFMLTRWEEYVNKTRDRHNRFPATASIAHLHGFLDRPIVNEYVEMLWNMLVFLDSTLERKNNGFQLFITHDVDSIRMWTNWHQVIRIAAGDVLKRRDLPQAAERLAEFFLIKRKRIKDPYDTFDWLMDKSESLGLKSRFYFMAGGLTKYDNIYSPHDSRVLTLIERIKTRKHTIGFHASYNSYNIFEQIKLEKETLESVVDEDLSEGRQHYLRFEAPITWQIWEENNLKIDSSCGYADKPGFRCGTGNEFTVFNFLTRKRLNLKERPLIIMDCSLFGYESYNYPRAQDTALHLRERCKNSSITVLWHNSYDSHRDFYEILLSCFRN